MNRREIGRPRLIQSSSSFLIYRFIALTLLSDLVAPSLPFTPDECEDEVLSLGSVQPRPSAFTTIGLI